MWKMELSTFVLQTTHTIGKLGNKGDECAITAIKMIDFVWSLNK